MEAVIVSLIISGSAAFAGIPYFPKASGVFGILFLLLIILAIFLSFFKGGVIRARGKQVIISHNFMGGRAFVSRIGYNEIAYAEYHIKALHSRWGFSNYILIMEINKKSGKKISLYNELDIKESFPTENPDEYREYLKEQPLMQLCKYINERARLL